jgi:hypothetical protein
MRRQAGDGKGVGGEKEMLLSATRGIMWNARQRFYFLP